MVENILGKKKKFGFGTKKIKKNLRKKD